MKFSLKSKVGPVLRLVVDNPGFVPALHRGRLGKMKDMLKRVQVLSNGKYISKLERNALELAAWVEKMHADYARTHPWEAESLVYLTESPAEELRKAAMLELRARGYAVTYTEIRNRPGGRFSVSKLRARV